MINRDIITLIDSEDPASEAYRSLRTNILMRQFDHDMQVINVISTSASEGKSTTILNLGVVFAQLGKKTLVLDLDLRLPTIHKKMKVKNKIGVSDVVTRNARFSDALIQYTENLDLITSGTKIPYAAEFLQSEILKEFISGLREMYDVILIDCPPVGLVTDGIIVSNYCDGTLLVVASGQDERKDLLRVKEQLEQTHTNVIGIVMTKMPVSKKYYNSAYRYAETSKKARKRK
ncbi:MAG: CpsD/CapB family tyrosine-protein kinase [Erysipelotrichaceae bacterium]|nr:CpsD/CapB family tyrosine-protein kinase [Erysipelotrichaceae bacterium]